MREVAQRGGTGAALAQPLPRVAFAAAFTLACLACGADAAATGASAAPLNATIASLTATLAEANDALDTMWLLACAIVVVTMQAGFALYESGLVHARHAASVTLKNLVDFSLGATVFYAFGWSFAWGEGAGTTPFAGGGELIGVGLDEARLPWQFFQFAFSATAATIVSGGVVGRMKFSVYCVMTCIITGIAYPFACHWVWSDTGFLKAMGFVDFAGASPVHMLGGVAAIMSTVVLGARRGVFVGHAHRPERSDPKMSVIGVFMMWAAWFAFNAGNSRGFTRGRHIVAARAALATAISSGGGTGVALAFSAINSAGQRHHVDVYRVMTGTLASLVSITGACAYVDGWQAFIIGAVGAVLAQLASETLVRFRIDDPCDVLGIHAVGGAWGVVSVGVFADTSTIPGRDSTLQGLVHGGGFRLLGVQALGGFIIVAWSGMVSALALALLHKTFGLRVSREEEAEGLDAAVNASVEATELSHALDARIKDAVFETMLAHGWRPDGGGISGSGGVSGDEGGANGKGKGKAKGKGKGKNVSFSSASGNGDAESKAAAMLLRARGGGGGGASAGAGAASAPMIAALAAKASSGSGRITNTGTGSGAVAGGGSAGRGMVKAATATPTPRKVARGRSGSGSSSSSSGSGSGSSSGSSRSGSVRSWHSNDDPSPFANGGASGGRRSKGKGKAKGKGRGGNRSGSGGGGGSGRRASAADKAAAEAARKRGNAAFAADDFATAHREFGVALERDPHDHVAWNSRSAANLSMGRARDALSDARTAVSLDPKYAKGHERVGHACMALSEWAAAADAYQTSMTLRGDRSLQDDYEEARARANGTWGRDDSDDSSGGRGGAGAGAGAGVGRVVQGGGLLAALSAASDVAFGAPAGGGGGGSVAVPMAGAMRPSSPTSSWSSDSSRGRGRGGGGGGGHGHDSSSRKGKGKRHSKGKAKAKATGEAAGAALQANPAFAYATPVSSVGRNSSIASGGGGGVGARSIGAGVTPPYGLPPSR